MSSGRRRHARLVALNRALLRFERRLEDDLLAALRRLSWHVNDRWTIGADQMLAEWIDEFERACRVALSKHLLSAAMAFGDEGLKHLDEIITGKASREALHAGVREWIDRYSFAKTQVLTEAIREEARKALSISVNKGESGKQLAKRLAKAIGSKQVKWSINRVARTEAHTASEIGSFEAARSTGLDVVKEWAAVEDIRTRRSHAIADGQIRELNQPFEVGGEHLMHPGDPNGSAKQIVNCRCIALYHPRVNGEIIR